MFAFPRSFPHLVFSLLTPKTGIVFSIPILIIQEHILEKRSIWQETGNFISISSPFLCIRVLSEFEGEDRLSVGSPKKRGLRIPNLHKLALHPP